MNKLRKISIIFSFMFLISIAFGCHFDNPSHLFSGITISPSGEVKKIKKDFKDFSAISVSHGFETIIKIGDSESVEIEANENLFEHIEVLQKGESLEFGTKDNCNFSNDAKIKIYITAKKITAIEGSGGSYIKSEDELKSSAFAVELSGGSKLNSKIDCGKTAIELSGGSETNLSGKCEEFVVSLSGGSQIKAGSLSVENLTADLSGGSIVNLIVNGNLVVDASGGSRVNYSGNGVIKASDLSGGSEINKK